MNYFVLVVLIQKDITKFHIMPINFKDQQRIGMGDEVPEEAYNINNTKFSWYEKENNFAILCVVMMDTWY